MSAMYMKKRKEQKNKETDQKKVKRMIPNRQHNSPPSERRWREKYDKKKGRKKARKKEGETEKTERNPFLGGDQLVTGHAL